MPAESPGLFLAFIAGLVSFISPCVLPLVPAYIGYMSGSALATARGTATPAGGGATGGTGGTVVASTGMSTAAARSIVLLHSILFVIGFTFVFVVVIGGLAGFLSDAFRENKRTVQYVMGVLLVIFGLHMMGAINLPFLNYTRRLELRPATNLGYLRSLLIGMGFGIGWTPCIGPVLTSVFTLSLTGRQGEAFPLFLAYALGLGVPFIAAALATGQISGWLKKMTRHSFSFKLGGVTLLKEVNVVSLVSGLLLIAMGVLIFFNWLTILAPPVSFIEGI